MRRSTRCNDRPHIGCITNTHRPIYTDARTHKRTNAALKQPQQSQQYSATSSVAACLLKHSKGVKLTAATVCKTLIDAAKVETEAEILKYR